MRKFLTVAATFGVIAVVAKKMSSRRSDWRGLTEIELRSKLGERLPNRIPEERRQVMTDKIVEKMRARGALLDDDIFMDDEAVDEREPIDVYQDAQEPETTPVQ